MVQFKMVFRRVRRQMSQSNDAGYRRPDGHHRQHVLLKEVRKDSFVFTPTIEAGKRRELAANPQRLGLLLPELPAAGAYNAGEKD